MAQITFHHIIRLIFVLSISFIFYACRSSEPQLKLLDPDEVVQMQWNDDLPLESLEEALKHSANFYQRMPESKRFSFGEQKYSPKEMLASNARLLDILKTTTGTERTKLIQKEFLIFESMNKNQKAFFTGYFEPTISGSFTKSREFPIPIHTKPYDLIYVNLSKFSKTLKGKTIVGKLKGNQLVPYDTHREILEENSLAGRADILVYTKHIDLFFLQIQGSGLVQLEDGSILQLNYAAKNGRAYRAIGKLLLDQGKMSREEISMQSLKQYLNDHPEEAKEILYYNQSYVFFREQTGGTGPIGYMGEPLTAKRSLAVDYRLLPMGSIAWLQTEKSLFDGQQLVGQQPIQRFATLQDTGGAIRGHGRVDIFWGRGNQAALNAGYQKHAGRLFVLVIKK